MQLCKKFDGWIQQDRQGSPHLVAHRYTTYPNTVYDFFESISVKKFRITCPTEMYLSQVVLCGTGFLWGGLAVI